MVKAWMVCIDDYERLYQLYYGDTVGKAKAEAAQDIGIPYTDVRAARAAKFDNDEGRSPTPAEWLRNGYGHTCYDCERMVYDGDGGSVDQHGNVFCPDCTEANEEG